jgi:hypothetical protein
VIHWIYSTRKLNMVTAYSCSRSLPICFADKDKLNMVTSIVYNTNWNIGWQNMVIAQKLNKTHEWWLHHKTDQNSTENKTEQTRSADHEIDCSRITSWWVSNQLFEWMLKDNSIQFSYYTEPNQSDKGTLVGSIYYTNQSQSRGATTHNNVYKFQ